MMADQSGGPVFAPAASVTVPCLHARVRIADPTLEVRRAREQGHRGDAVWRERLRRFEDGDTLLVALTASAAIDSNGRRSDLLCFCHEVVWIDRQTPVSVLTERVRELAHRDFQAVGSQLRDHGIELSASEDVIGVHLVIDPAVAESLESTGKIDLANVAPPEQSPRREPTSADGHHGDGARGSASVARDPWS